MRLQALKPAAPVRIHLLLAALLWTTVGASLAGAGMRWLGTASGRLSWPLLGGAATLGVVKALLVLRPAAVRIVERIRARGDGRCLGGFLSWRTWLIVAAMAGLGRGLRAAGLSPAVAGFAYVAVGVALATGSWWAWRTVCAHGGEAGRERP